MLIVIFVPAACDEEAEETEHAREARRFLLGHSLVGHRSCNLCCLGLGSDNKLAVKHKRSAERDDFSGLDSSTTDISCPKLLKHFLPSHDDM